MQDRYVADLGDFGKLGLLKALSDPKTPETRTISLGIIWYLVPDESHNDDGKHIRYLDPTPQNERRFRACDPVLYDALAGIVATKARNVGAVGASGILPPGTVFYSVPLTFHGMAAVGDSARQRRLAHRRSWFDGALAATATCDLVFLDPDNGLEVGTKQHQRRGPKYVYIDDLTELLARGQSVVVYHHIGREGSADIQIRRRMDQVEDLLVSKGNGTSPLALLYRRGTARAFIVIPSERDRALLTARIEAFSVGSWAEHFDFGKR